MEAVADKQMRGAAAQDQPLPFTAEGLCRPDGVRARLVLEQAHVVLAGMPLAQLVQVRAERAQRGGRRRGWPCRDPATWPHTPSGGGST
ncbi:hypothetical protein [Serinicoccus marinus]|uniref:hypothetical protein n=1 Tax=Serinicoccus marinus TaxID=247333 RepID=UPI002492679B|nr:hypothetical protein [Serinicoccus marinus]